MKNTKQIEESATNALKTALLKCSILDSFIDSNDKTPSWDGSVIVYKSENHKKENMIGRVPIQVKGTTKIFNDDNATFSCNLVDLNNYYHDGGCIFFVVSVIPETGLHKIFYKSLLVVDLNQMIRESKSKKYCTIQLSLFPEDNLKEMAHIFLLFTSNAYKQSSFIGKDFLSVDELEKRGIKIESLVFNISGIGLNEIDLPRFIVEHDFYMYAKPEGIDIEIPVDKITNAIIFKTVRGDINVKGKNYYSSYKVEYLKEKSVIRIGMGITVTFLDKDKYSIKFKAIGTLSDFIRDASFFLDALENREISINGVKFSFDDPITLDISLKRKTIKYYEDVKKMLDLLGVNEELLLNSITSEDYSNLKMLVNAVLFNQKISFSSMTKKYFYGPFKIANLVIWIWATRNKEGKYSIRNFFSPRNIAVSASDDSDGRNSIQISQFLFLNKSAFIHTSNMNYDVIYQDVIQKEINDIIVNKYVLWLLDILTAYDEQKQKDPKLLEFAEKICDWIYMKDLVDNKIMLLNKIQIVKRKRKLTTSEIIELAKLTENDCSSEIRCGAHLLLDDNEAAQKCFDEMDKESKSIFLKYPICHFGNLYNEEEY